MFYLYGFNFVSLISTVLTTLAREPYLFTLLIFMMREITFLIASPTRNNIGFIAFRFIASLGTVGFVITNSLYDHLYRNYADIKRGFTLSYIFNRLLVGFVFALNICVGFTSSTAVWFVPLSDYTWLKILGIIGSSIVSYLSSIAWLWLAKLSVRGNITQYLLGRSYPWLNNLSTFIVKSRARLSFFRSIFEATSLTFLSWLNFTIWHYLYSYKWRYYNTVWLIVGLALYIPSAHIVIYCEQYFTYLILYGLFYLISFSSLSFLTNGIIYIWLPNVSNSVLLIKLCLSSVMVLLFPLQIYRTVGASQDSSRVPPIIRKDKLIHMAGVIIYFLVSFYTFANFTYLIYFLYFPYWFS